MTKKKIDSLSRPDDLRRRAEEMVRGKTPQSSENLDTLSLKEQQQLLYELRVHQIELTMQNESLRRTQEELESSQSRYYNLYDLASVGYFTQNKDGLILEANLKAGSLLGVARKTLNKKLFTHFIHREDQDIYYHHRKQLFETGAPQTCDLRLMKKEGFPFWVRLESTIVQDSKKGDTLYYTVINDITEHKQIEESLRTERQRLHNVLEVMPMMVCLLTPDYHIAFANRAFREKFGESKGRHCYEYCFGKKEPCDFCESYEVLKTGKTHHWEVTCPDGATIIDVYEFPFTDVDGSSLILEVDIDITERKQAEKTLFETKEYLEKLIKYANAPIIVWDTSLSITRFNKAFENLSGYDASEVIGKKIDILFSKNKIESALEHIQKTSSGERWETAEVEIQRKDGEPRIVLWNSANILDTEKNNVIATIAQGQDITQRKQAEEKLKKTRDAILETMSKIVEAKDPYTAGHQQRVYQLATAIAKELNLSQDKIEGIRIASLIHDIGKIGLPTEILSKPSKLFDIEFSLIKSHSQIGYDVLKSIDFSYPVANIVLQHHERLDGSGYPQGFKGEDILMEAKIIGVADVVEAISSHRPYRPALGIDKALEEIFRNRGILYDPKVVDACLKLFKEKGFKFE